MSARIKFHHPSIFACALLNSQLMGFYSINQIITDAEKHDVEISPLCIDNSLWECSGTMLSGKGFLI